MSTLTERQERGFPADIDSETGIIGSILLNPDVIDDVTAIVRPDDFYTAPYRVIFAHAQAIHAQGKIPDTRLLTAAIRKAGELDEEGLFYKRGLAATLEELFERCPTAHNAVHYARKLKESSTLRSLIDVCEMGARDAYAHDADAEKLLSRIETQVAKISESGRQQTEVDMRDVLSQALARIPEAGVAAEPCGVLTGYIDLDKMLGGMKPGEIIVLAGRPSMGKSAFAGNIVERVALELGETVVLFSLEMNRLSLADRMLFSLAKVPHSKASTGFLTVSERQKLVQANAELSKGKIQIDDSPNPTVSQIGATCRRIKRRHGLGLVVIDYLQLVSPDNPRDPRQEQVAKISRSLKGLAGQLGCPILCLAQLNRQVEASLDHRPKLSHLRESGAIEQDADVVLFVHREEHYAKTMKEKADSAGKAEIIVSKQRNGPTGIVPLTWIADYVRFETTAKCQEFDPSQFDYPEGYYGE